MRLALFFLAICLCAVGQPFYIDQLESRNVLIGDSSQMPITPLNGKLRLMSPLYVLPTNGSILTLEGDDPAFQTWKMVVANNCTVDSVGNITAGNNLYGVNLGLGGGPSFNTAGWDGTQWYGNGYGLTNLSAATVNGFQALTNGHSVAVTISNIFNSIGNINLKSNLNIGSVLPANINESPLHIASGASYPLIIRNAADTTTLMYVTSGGTVTFAGDILASGGSSSVKVRYFQDTASNKGYWDTGTSGVNWQNINRVTGNVSVQIKGIGAQTADLFQCVTNTGAVLMNVTASGNQTLAGTLTATNGIVVQRMPCSSNAVTVVSGQQIYCVNGTNQLITLPAANVSWGTNIIYRFTSTNGWGSFIITNANGTTRIRDGTSLSYTNIGIGEVGMFSDGAAWWLASKARTILPSASWSSATTITPAQDTITNIPWTDLEYNNSQGITLRTNSTFSRPTELWVTNSGTHMITFSAVLKGSGGGSVISIWLRKNGVDVPRTRTDQGFTGASAQQCMTVNYFVNVGAPSYFELCAASHDASPPTIVGGTANPTGYTAPAMPAVIVTINRVSDPWP